MKRVLIISYYWPPSGGSGVQRWVKFSKYLPSLGWQPVVYTPENPELTATDDCLGAEIPPQAEVIKTRIFEPYEIYRTLSGKKGSKPGQGEVNPINGEKKSLGKSLSMWIRGNFFIPDPRCFWVGPSVKFLRKYLEEHPVDIIVSTGPPHSMHLIAMKLAKATGLPWVADFRDPWTKMFYFKHLKLTGWARWRHKRLEKKVLDRATRVISVSPLVQMEFQAMTKTPVELITNGFDEEDFKRDVPRGRFFNIVHTGLFASDGNPDKLWSALRAICDSDPEFQDKLRIRLAGKTDKEIIDSIEAAGLGENLVNLNYVNHNQAVQEQMGASLLILPLRKEPEYKAVLPGKLFEYLASEVPVLGIGQSDGAMAMIIKDTKAGVIFDWEDEASIKRYVEHCWKSSTSGTPVGGAENIAGYSRKALAGKLAELLEAIVNQAEK